MKRRGEERRGGEEERSRRRGGAGREERRGRKLPRRILDFEGDFADAIQALIDGDVKEARKQAKTEPEYEDELIDALKRSNTLARILQKRRQRDGMITLALPEVELVFDDEGHVTDAQSVPWPWKRPPIDMQSRPSSARRRCSSSCSMASIASSPDRTTHSASARFPRCSAFKPSALYGAGRFGSSRIDSSYQRRASVAVRAERPFS